MYRIWFERKYGYALKFLRDWKIYLHEQQYYTLWLLKAETWFATSKTESEKKKKKVFWVQAYL